MEISNGTVGVYNNIENVVFYNPKLRSKLGSSIDES